MSGTGPGRILLSDFLARVLEAHGELLAELRGIMGTPGDAPLLDALDSFPRDEVLQRGRSEFSEWKTCWQSPDDADDDANAGASSPTGPHEILESATRRSHLSEMLEAYLWDYPLYRVYIESQLPLDSMLRHAPGTGTRLAESTMIAAREWIRLFPLRADLRDRAENASHRVWIRVRSWILRETGDLTLRVIH